MTTLPKLPAPEIIGVAGFCDDGIGYTEAQVLKLRADTVEACAALCHELANTENTHDYVAGAEWCEARILSMRKEETE